MICKYKCVFWGRLFIWDAPRLRPWVLAWAYTGLFGKIGEGVLAYVNQLALDIAVQTLIVSIAVKPTYHMTIKM